MFEKVEIVLSPKFRIEEAEAQCALLNSESLCVSLLLIYIGLS